MSTFSARSAREFMNEVRAAQSESGKSLAGARGLKKEQRLAIRAAARSYIGATVPDHVTQEMMVGLLDRFEEMCRRQAMPIDEYLRADVLNLLVTELLVNQQALRSPDLAALVALTAFSGAVGPSLVSAFAEFAAPATLRYAVAARPADPHNFLAQARQTAAAMAEEDEFADFRGAPVIFRTVAVTHSDPRGFLRNVKATVTAMAQEEEFAEFANMPGLLRCVAMGNASNPRGFLRKVKATVASIEREGEFAEFAPNLLLRAAIANSPDPRPFLRKAQANIAAMANEEEFAKLGRAALRYAAVHNPSNPREGIRSGMLDRSHAAAVSQRMERAKPPAR